MRRAQSTSLLVLSLSWLASGCATPQHDNWAASTLAPAALSGASTSERGKIEADASALASPEEVDEKLGLGKLGPLNYVALSATDCQCQAAARSSLANLIEMEREIAANAARGCFHRKAACAADMKDDLLALRAVEERNRSAAAALEFYYRLAEAEAGLDVLQQSQQAVDHALENIDALRKKGLKVTVDEEALRRRKTELFDQQAEAELGRDQAHGGLKVLLDLADEDPTRIWPQADLVAVVEPLDVEGAVAEGLASRAELIILRCVSESLTAQTLPGARGALSQRDASLGSSSLDMRKLHMLLAGARGERELPARQAQLAQLLADSERTVTQEIRGAAATVATRLKQASLARQALDGRRRHVEELERKRQVGSATSADVAAERLEIIKAEGELMRRLVAWRIAQVKLKQSQGLLSAECGYQHTPCCGNGGACGPGGCMECLPLASHVEPPRVLATASATALPVKSPSGPRIVRIGAPKRESPSEQLAGPRGARRLR